MLKDFFENYIYPISTLAGSIVGVGFLSLPHIALKVGIWPMLFYFIVLTILIVILHIIFGQISLKTPDHKRFPGFVGFYLGPYAEALAILLMIFGSFVVLLVYVIVGSQFLTAMLQPFFGGTELMYIFLYCAANGVLVYFGIKAISRFEFWFLVLLLLSFFIIFITSFSQLHLAGIFFQFSSFKLQPATLFLPLGPMIFALWGTGLIPETEEMLVGRKKSLKKIIIISTLIPAGIYVLFIFLVLGISGSQTTETALTGLKGFLGEGIFLVALFVGFMATFASSVTQGLILKKTFLYDMKFGEFSAWTLTCIIPLLLFFLGFNSFIPLISFTGGVVLSIDGILILLMYKKIGGKNIIVYPSVAIFLLIIAYYLWPGMSL